MEYEEYLYNHHEKNADGLCGIPPKGSCTKPSKFMFIYKAHGIVASLVGVDYQSGSACEEHMVIARDTLSLVVEQAYDPIKHDSHCSTKWFIRTLEEMGL